ncbi:MAG: ATP-binding cassette domain-containing protein [Lentisphaeraceae bacterium]|nr:ATP-binding cassette domain-containing protein [Lentisphaeraceae bacterium]
MIKVENLCRNFGEIKAVKNISFSVEKGDILGFIGPNGAGKSTTMRMITGYLTPSSGTVEINGKNLLDNESFCKDSIGYLPESAPMYGDMTVRNFLLFCGDIRGMSTQERKTAVDSVIEKCFLQKVEHQTISTLSKGFRQRTCFAQSILHDPPVLILDEPTDGLDPNQKYEIRKIIRNFGKDKAIILSTHILEEVESLCNRVILLSQGEKKADEPIAEFTARNSKLSATFRELTVGGKIEEETEA